MPENEYSDIAGMEPGTPPAPPSADQQSISSESQQPQQALQPLREVREAPMIPGGAVAFYGGICPRCHLPLPAGAYFCPNCGEELSPKPLSTSVFTQAWIYALSVFLPMIAFLGLHYWPGPKYLRSGDEKAKRIGIIAVILMVASTVITFWLAIVWIQGYVQQSVNSVGNLGNLGGF